ncbi:hypothetical protein DPMN_026341 [Dreissena polymorpha]|uniref:Protein Wnt n=2 Tax=Dreissena polymorpha TaxID=45954 RepID=A0A9D4RCH8_DREPO|nr:hypothetical protein DPMN_026341 [Dreissena polymorpha]
MLMPREKTAEKKIPTDEVSLNKSYLIIVESIREGLEEAAEECKHQFRWDRWNCPVTSTNIVSKSRQSQATREVAFLQSVSAAGIMYSVTESCNRADNALCSCGDGGKFHYGHDTLHWKWGGCSHNVQFGEKVSRLYLGTGKASADISNALKSHNERAGHKTVKHTMKTTCKCHGVTGSCQMRTCWKHMSNFRLIGDKLRKKFKRAKDLRHMRGFMPYTNKVRHPKLTKISKDDLVHFEDSPLYCETDNASGYLGTLGRECLKLEKGANKSSMSKFERHSCRRLCNECGHRVGRHLVREEYDCDCEFRWCCSVQCRRCTRDVTRYYCK